MSRVRLFVENFLVYGFINILNKLIPFILLPLITRLLPNTSDFGNFDMFNLIMNFGSQIAILGMYDAMFREYFEKEEQQYRYNVTATAQRIVLINSLIICFILIVFSGVFSKLFFGNIDNQKIVFFSSIGLLLSANNNVVSTPTRIQNKKKIFIFSGLLNSGLYYFLSIILIILGLNFEALIFSRIVSLLALLLFFWLLNKKFFLKGTYSTKVSKELFKIGLPLVPALLIHWIFKSMDRIMITHFLGTAELGIYAIGARVAQISQFIEVGFSMGWKYFVFKTMKDKDYNIMLGNIWELMFVFCTLFFCIGYLVKDFLFRTMFVADYVKGVEVFPFLLLGPLMLLLYRIFAIQFQVIKKTYYSPIILTCGAAINVTFNYYLIPDMGIKGAALATVLGYLITVLIAFFIMFRKKLILFNIKTFFITTLFLLLFGLIVFFEDKKFLINYSITVYILSVLLMYYKRIIGYMKKLRK